MYLNCIWQVVSSGKIGLTDIEEEPWLLPSKIVELESKFGRNKLAVSKGKVKDIECFFIRWQPHNSIICPIFIDVGALLGQKQLNFSFDRCQTYEIFSNIALHSGRNIPDVSLVVLIHESGRQIWIKPIPVFSARVRTYRRHPQLITTSIHHNSQELTWCSEFHIHMIVKLW